MSTQIPFPGGMNDRGGGGGRARRWQQRSKEKINLLLDLAQAAPDGFTYADVKTRFGWSYSQFMDTVRRVRTLCADAYKTLPCIPDGPRERWRYYYTAEQPPFRSWLRTRILDGERRVHTMYNVARSAVVATDARTQEGKVARVLAKHLGRCCEDLAEIRREEKLS